MQQIPYGTACSVSLAALQHAQQVHTPDSDTVRPEFDHGQATVTRHPVGAPPPDTQKRGGLWHGNRCNSAEFIERVNPRGGVHTSH